MNLAKENTRSHHILVTLSQELIKALETLRQEQEAHDSEPVAAARMIRMLVRTHPKIQECLEAQKARP